MEFILYIHFKASHLTILIIFIFIILITFHLEFSDILATGLYYCGLCNRLEDLFFQLGISLSCYTLCVETANCSNFMRKIAHSLHSHFFMDLADYRFVKAFFILYYDNQILFLPCWFCSLVYSVTGT